MWCVLFICKPTGMLCTLISQMIANAGIYIPGFLIDGMIATCILSTISEHKSVTTADWDRTMRVNGLGPFLCYKYAAIQMIAQGRGGNIVGIR
jgi:NAD(P)-dependent dehydrogenase (short-subunit alcohol dehydrogenase family)